MNKLNITSKNKTETITQPKQKLWRSRIVNFQSIVVAVLLIALPFHAFGVILTSQVVGHQLLIAAWKEVLVILLAISTLVIIYLDHDIKWLNRPANLAIMAAIGFGILSSIINWRFDVAWLAGVKTTILPLVLFLIVQPVANKFSDQRLEKLVLWPALIVSSIAIWQFITIPTTLLSWLGYSAKTIIPFQTLTANFNVARAFSTLGGPNQLGVYLILPAIWLFIKSIKSTTQNSRIYSAIAFCLVVIGLTVSFSRSAILGLVVGLVAALVLVVPKSWRVWLIGGITVSGLVIWLTVQAVVTTGPPSAIKGFLFRGEFSSAGVIGSDQGHVNSVDQGLRLVVSHPFGLGLGSAGPASFYSQSNAQLITENWFIQIALELGLLGLISLLLGFYYLIRSWLKNLQIKSKQKPAIFMTAMIASTIGLIVANMFLHSFADSTLGLIYFCLAGIALARKTSL